MTIPDMLESLMFPLSPLLVCIGMVLSVASLSVSVHSTISVCFTNHLDSCHPKLHSKIHFFEVKHINNRYVWSGVMCVLCGIVKGEIDVCIRAD